VGKLTERALRAKHRVNPCVRCLLEPRTGGRGRALAFLGTVVQTPRQTSDCLGQLIRNA